jgi:hypothetical protein
MKYVIQALLKQIFTPEKQRFSTTLLYFQSEFYAGRFSKSLDPLLNET